MNNTAISQNVVQELCGSESCSEQVGKTDSWAPPQPTQSKFGEGKVQDSTFSKSCLVILMHTKV